MMIMNDMPAIKMLLSLANIEATRSTPVNIGEYSGEMRDVE